MTTGTTQLSKYKGYSNLEQIGDAAKKLASAIGDLSWCLPSAKEDWEVNTMMEHLRQAQDFLVRIGEANGVKFARNLW